ncbi:MAG: hypothetical protein ACOH10_12425 [Rhodoglobus sp.]
MTARLASVAPDIVEVLGRNPPARLRAIAVDAGEWIVEIVGLVDPRLDAALAAMRDLRVGASPERNALKVLVDELDERAWEVQDDVDAGSAPQEAYIVAFSLARAASAVWFALDSDALHAALEAIYEAQAATGDLAGARRRVQELLA